MKLAGNLQINRRRMGLSQEELAEKCQISRQAIAKWESGESVPTIEKLIFLADFYVFLQRRNIQILADSAATLDELVGRKEDVALFEDFIKRYVPSDVRFGDDDDVLPVINRFLAYMDKHGFSAEEKLASMKEVSLSGTDYE